MSKKRIITLLSLVFVLAVLVGGYFIADHFGLFDEPTENNDVDETDNNIVEEQEDKSIFDYGESEIEYITIENKEEVIEFVKTKETYENEEGQEEEKEIYSITGVEREINSSVADSLYSTMKNLAYITYIGEVDDLSEFGLQSPKIMITAKTYDASSYSLMVGDNVPGEESYYAMNPENREVVIISSYRSEKIVLSLTDCIDTELLNYTTEDLTGVSIKRKGEEKIVAEFKSEEELESAAYSFEKMKIVEPIKWDANGTNILTGLEPFLTLSAKSFVELNASDLSKYGLDDPDYTISLKTSDGNEFTLKLGDNVEGESLRYAVEEGNLDVMTISESNLGFIDIPLKDLMSSFIIIVNIDDVKTIDFKAKDYDLHCEIDPAKEDSDEEDMFYVNGMDATAEDESDSQYFRKFYQALLSAFVYDFDFDAQPKGDPEISMVFELSDGTKKEIEYIKRDEYTYYAFVDGEYTGVIVRAQDFYEEDGIYEVLPDLMDNLKEIEE